MGGRLSRRVSPFTPIQEVPSDQVNFELLVHAHELINAISVFRAKLLTSNTITPRAKEAESLIDPLLIFLSQDIVRNYSQFREHYWLVCSLWLYSAHVVVRFAASLQKEYSKLSMKGEDADATDRFRLSNIQQQIEHSNTILSGAQLVMCDPSINWDAIQRCVSPDKNTMYLQYFDFVNYCQSLNEYLIRCQEMFVLFPQQKLRQSVSRQVYHYDPELDKTVNEFSDFVKQVLPMRYQSSAPRARAHPTALLFDDDSLTSSDTRVQYQEDCQTTI